MRKEELGHQIAVLDYCRLKRWPVWATDQSAPLGSMRGGRWAPNFATIASRKKQGVRPGLPDLAVFVSTYGKVTLAFVEMKRPLGPRGGKNGSEETEGQLEFRSLCALAEIPFAVCHGFEEAKRYLDWVES